MANIGTRGYTEKIRFDLEIQHYAASIPHFLVQLSDGTQSKQGNINIMCTTVEPC